MWYNDETYKITFKIVEELDKIIDRLTSEEKNNFAYSLLNLGKDFKYFANSYPDNIFWSYDLFEGVFVLSTQRGYLKVSFTRSGKLHEKILPNLDEMV